MEEEIHILIGDDQEVVRIGLATLLSQVPDFRVLGHVTTAQEAVKRVKECRPDVAILDIFLPGDAVGACQQISSRAKRTKILILTSRDDERILIDAIMAGIRGYILKKTPGEKLVKMIRMIHQGQYILDPELTERVFDYIKKPSHFRPAHRKLSQQEELILELLGEGMTNREIAERVHLAERTVRNYVSNILKKLDLKNRVEAATFITRRRYD